MTRVELQQSSGSNVIDNALVALFNNANWPPLPGETEPVTFHFTMHYNLDRQQ